MVLNYYKIAQDPNIYQKLIESFAPSIYEMDDVKKGLLCQLFGGSNGGGGGPGAGAGRFRGDINVLLVGDPGTHFSLCLSLSLSLSYSRSLFLSLSLSLSDFSPLANFLATSFLPCSCCVVDVRKFLEACQNRSCCSTFTR